MRSSHSLRSDSHPLEPTTAATVAKRPDLLGLAEVAELLGLSKGALGERRRKRYRPGDLLPTFPAPIVTLACGPIWERPQIEAYAGECERLAKLTWFQRKYGEDAFDPIEAALHRPRPQEKRR